MAITLDECTQLADELRNGLIGGRIQKIHQPESALLIFHVRLPGQSLRLLLCVDPKSARIHITTTAYHNPPSPPGFCQFLRAHLEGSRIEHIEQEPGDRVLYLTARRGIATHILIATFTGNQSNAFLATEQRAILRSLRPCRFRAGETFTPPAARAQPSPGTKPTMNASPESPDTEPSFPVSAAIEARYGEQAHTDHSIQQYRAHLAALRKRVKQLTKRHRHLVEDMARASQYQEYGRYGELLKARLHEIQPRQDSIDVVDYYDSALPTLSLPLNPLKDAAWNLEDYFRKFHKYQAAQTHLRPRIADAEREINTANAEIVKLQDAELDAILTPDPKTEHHTQPQGHVKLTFSQPPTSIPPAQHSPKGQQTARGYRTYESVDGLSILVGKSATDNDQLTFNVARPHDLWLHARGCPGSHVIVRLEKATDAPHETLRDAATLALHFSDLKKAGKGEVIYTLRKFVKKSKGQKAGAVQVTREKSLWIDISEERLRRLKGP